MGMDCLNFVFNHTDLRPTNIIVENKPNSKKVGIIDFEIAGYFPQSWIKTKFRISSGMDLSRSAADDPYW
jgi:predicted unusual protein kinase regulating ubiquinone biosynthesis (AarF/ABC1/UbiB family)